MLITVEQAIQTLQTGNVVAIPTETVYGLAASLTNLSAIEKIFHLKGRPLTNPLIIHVAHALDVQTYAESLPPGFEDLVKAFWPGPLTMIVPIRPSLIPPLVRAQLPTAGFRMPEHPMALRVIESTGPLVMPSANLSGKPSATKVRHVEQDFGRDFPVLDGGNCKKGLESTILYYESPRWIVVRMGVLAAEVFEPILGYQPESQKAFKHAQPICPGQFFRHYAPQAKMILGNPEGLQRSLFVLGFNERTYPEGKEILFMGSLYDPEGVAEKLYDCLRRLDQQGIQQVWVDMDFPREGLWKTIAERLMRAAEG